MTYDQDKARDRTGEEADRRHEARPLRRCVVCGAWTTSEDGWGYPQCRVHAEHAEARKAAKGW